MLHDGHDSRWSLGVGHFADHTVGEFVHDPGPGDRLDSGCDELTLDPAAGRHGLAHQDVAFDHQDTLVLTRTAAPQEAPQSLNVLIGETESHSGSVRPTRPWPPPPTW